MLRIALCQMTVGMDKAANLKKAVEMITKASEKGSKLVVLPECFNSPYGTQFFEKYAETEKDSVTLKTISETAKSLKLHILAGSIPFRRYENDGLGKLYNSSFTFNDQGEIIAEFDKIHLFDIDIPGKISFQESLKLTGGSKLSTFQVNDFKIGVGICFDIRFPELTQLYSQKKGCHAVIMPGAFNMTTGPLHWELLTRCRAVDNQIYFGVCSPARVDAKDSGGYVAWGHSMLCDPLGQKLVELDENEGICYGDMDLKVINDTRNQIPVLKNKRQDLYSLIEK